MRSFDGSNVAHWALLFVLCVQLSSCRMQEVVQQQQPQQSQTRPQQRSQPTQTPRNTITRWRSNPVPATHNCDYKEMMTNMHDRVSLLVSLDEEQRARLDSIDKKIVQFEISNLARMDSLKVQQMDLSKRLESMEYAQRLTQSDLKELKEELEDFLREYKNQNINEVPLTRQSRQTDQSSMNYTDAAIATSDSQKLDALAILLTSTRAAISGLQAQLQANLTKIIQMTNSLQRRINSIIRRSQSNDVYPPAVHPNFYSPTNTQRQLITSCDQGVATVNGVLQLQLTPTSDPFYVTCDDQYLGGGWTVILNRFNGDINFERGWSDYKNGFGNLAGEFFIGLDKLSALTASAVHELLIILEDFENNVRFARYDLFAIGSERESYEMKLLGKYNGTAGDSLTYHAGSKFSTSDNDNDGCVDCNCALSHKGAWWYNWCEQSNLMGPYHSTDYDKIEQFRGMYWHGWRGDTYSLKAAKMMIRPVSVD